MGQKLAGLHAATPACIGVVPLRRPMRAPRSITPLRALYDEAGFGASWLAKSLDGHRITCSGLTGPVPSGGTEWTAIGEGVIRPCPACGGDHLWPVGVLVVHARDGSPPLDPSGTATVQGVLDARPDAAAPAGVRGRLALRDAVFLER
jgi:hypothetical protein